MKTSTKIKVVGIGARGSNTVSSMKKAKIQGVELVSSNTGTGIQDLRKLGRILN